MFYFDGKTDTMYYVTRESAKKGLSKILTSRVNRRFNSKTSDDIINDIMSNISIPNEYGNDKCIYMSADDEDCYNGKRFSITASEVINCINQNDGSKIVPIPIPKCKLKDFNASYYMPLDSTILFSELSEKSINNGVLKQKGNLKGMTFSLEESFDSVICSILKKVFSEEYSTLIAKKIIYCMADGFHRFFVYRIVAQKPVIYAVSRDEIQKVDIESRLSAAAIGMIINSYVKGIPGMAEKVIKLSNEIHNRILYDILYDKEELNDPYVYDGKKFGFKKTCEGIDFIFRRESHCWPVRQTNWISDFICVPFKDITWERTTKEADYGYIVSDNDYVEPSYKGFRLADLECDVNSFAECDIKSREDYSDMIKINKGNLYVFASTVNIKNERILLNGKGKNVKEDTPVYFMVAMDTYKYE